MRFAWKTDTFVLFQEWTTTTTAGLVSAAFLAFALAAIYEFLRYFMTSRSKHRHRDVNKRQKLVLLLIQTALYMMSALASNLLMLLLMTYNIWLFLFILIGAGCGFFIARPLFTVQTSLQIPQDIRHDKIYNPKSSNVEEPSPSHHYPLLPNAETSTQRVAHEMDDLDSERQRPPRDSEFSEPPRNKDNGIRGSKNEFKNDLVYDDDINRLLDSSPFKLNQETVMSTDI